MKSIIFSCFFMLCFFINKAVAVEKLTLVTYPNAAEINSSESHASDYLLALDSYKKINAMWGVAVSKNLSGKLIRKTLELPSEHSPESGFEFYKEQIEKYNVRQLFYCKARDCGTSNSWANNHFKIPQLYGLDQYQFYVAYEVTSASENPSYVVLYAVLRGNKKAYIQLDVLHADAADEFGVASNPNTLYKLLQTNGYFVFPDLFSSKALENTSLQIKNTHVSALAKVLLLNPNLKIALVGHDYSVGGVDAQLMQSKKYAEQIKTELMAQGADQKRVLVFGLGGLAPAGRGDRFARVEVVKITE